VLRNKIELIRDGEPQALLTWHKRDENGETTPVAIEFDESLDEESRRRIRDVAERPLNVREGGKNTKAFPGSSKHFLALPKVLARLGYRTRVL
jgi:hypothetical protein